MTAHDAADCLLCDRLAAALTTTRNGVEIPALCPTCDFHHHEGAPHNTANLPANVCTRCRTNRLAVQDAKESGRDTQKHYAAYCDACYAAMGYVWVTDVMGLSYYARFYSDTETRDPFAAWGSPSAAKERRTR